MATTTNFGWTTPNDTDLVKDGAAAIRTALNGVDTSFVGLKGGTTGQVLSKTSNTDLAYTWVAQDDSNAIQNAIVDAKGDLIAATANDTPARLAVGTNGQVLSADSTASTGLAWATPSSGGMTLINTGGTALSGSSVTVGSIPSGYKNLIIIIRDAYFASANGSMYMRLNADSGSNYAASQIRVFNTTISAANGLSSTNWNVAQSNSDQNLWNYKTQLVMNIYDYTNTDQIFVEWEAFENYTSIASAEYGRGVYNCSAAITSINLSGDYNFSGGTVYVYGVK